jgi:4-amino-4-deoxy-L-arabinose transferase-like glycosyltransferase
LLAVGLVGVLAPSDPYDWDSLAYHLAVPKIWLGDGQIHFISFIHHSNFPASVDCLYIWGLKYGGEAGAKAFSWAFAGLGVVAAFGFIRAKFDEIAGWWSALAVASIPLVVWESGTAYIDVANGLYVAFGILIAGEWIAAPQRRDRAWLAAVALGFAAGSKYTGLQTFAAVGTVLSAVMILGRRTEPRISLGTAAAAFALAGAIAAPWYIKNMVNTGNPVYPFFYSVFKGKNWDTFSDQIYREQQNTFGAGRAAEAPGHPFSANKLEPVRLGASVMGLAYQPGRYVDPGPTVGDGFPFQALGAIPLIGLLSWLAAGRQRRDQTAVVAMILLSLAMWFGLSQQARYILGLMLPLAMYAGVGVRRLPVGPLIGAGIVVQALATLVGLTRWHDVAPEESKFVEQFRVALGVTSPEDYRKKYVGFAEPAARLNELAKGGRVGLFDEVFGFYLDVPYFWATPGHSTEIGYAGLKDGPGFADSLRRLGITYAYLNLSLYGQTDPTYVRWVSALGIEGTPVPYTESEIRAQGTDIRNRWKVLFADAVAKGRLHLVDRVGRRLIFEVN